LRIWAKPNALIGDGIAHDNERPDRPLGQDPRRHRHAAEVSAAKIIAVALGLFFGAFVLWAVTTEDRSGASR